MNRDQSTKKPLDPTANTDQFNTDTTGSTKYFPPDQNVPGQTHSDMPGISKSMSRASYNEAVNQSSLSDSKAPGSPTPSSDDINSMTKPPHIVGEQSISGDMPDPDSDDSVDAAANQMGIGLSNNTENPAELDIASDIDKAEEYNKTH